jgi:hypothetical protein
MSYGEKAVGLDPSGDPQVKRLWSIAVTEAQGAQMRAVKAAAWRGP